MSTIPFLLIDSFGHSYLSLPRRFFLVTRAPLKFRAALCRNSDTHSIRVHGLRMHLRPPALSAVHCRRYTFHSPGPISPFASGRDVRQVRPRERTHASPRPHDRPFLEKVTGSSFASRQFFGDSLSSSCFFCVPVPHGEGRGPVHTCPPQVWGSFIRAGWMAAMRRAILVSPSESLSLPS